MPALYCYICNTRSQENISQEALVGQPWQVQLPGNGHDPSTELQCLMNPYQHHTDAELVALLIEGNERAFAVIYQRYAFDLYRYAMKNIQNSEDCKEIIQDIFESLWKRHAELNHVTILEAYLYRTVKYKIIRYTQHKAVKRKYAEHYQLFETVYDSIPEQDDRVHENIEASIDHFLKELPQRCQMVFRLRLKENLSNDDIAKRMNISNGRVRNYMVTAMNHLRAAFQKLNPGDL